MWSKQCGKSALIWLVALCLLEAFRNVGLKLQMYRNVLPAKIHKNQFMVNLMFMHIFIKHFVIHSPRGIETTVQSGSVLHSFAEKGFGAWLLYSSQFDILIRLDFRDIESLTQLQGILQENCLGKIKKSSSTMTDVFEGSWEHRAISCEWLTEIATDHSKSSASLILDNTNSFQTAYFSYQLRFLIFWLPH